MTNSTPHSQPRRSPRARAALLAGVVAAAGLVAIPASGIAGKAKTYQFGAKLTKQTQPSNSLPAHKCDSNPGQKCTWILNDAYQRPGKERAKRDGVIKRIKLIAGGPGSARLQIVKVNQAETKAKLVKQGPVLNYKGQTDPNALDYEIDRFKVKVPVKKGQQLAIKTAQTSAVRCSSGGPNNLQISPALKKGQGKRPVTDTDGCWLLLEAKVRY